MRAKLSAKMNDVIGEAQRGFMAGKQIVENVLEIDYDMIRSASSDTDSAAVRFDFTAAFPSVSHSYLWAVMTKMGIFHHGLSELISTCTGTMFTRYDLMAKPGTRSR